MKKVINLFLIAILTTLALGCSKTSATNQNDQYVYDLVITDKNIESLEKTLFASSFYNFDLFMDSDAYSLCKIDIINTEGKIAVTKYVFPDEKNHFVQKLYLNAKSTGLDISLQNKDSSEFTKLHSYKLIPTEQKKTPLMSYDKKTGITTYTIDHTNVDSLPNHLQVGKIYTFDINLPELEFESASYEIRLKNVQPPAYPMDADYLSKQPNGHYIKTVLLPNNVHELSITLYGSYWTDQMNVAFFRAEPNKKAAKLNLPKNQDKAKSYLKDKPDERIINYLEEVNARELCKEDPDKALIQFVNKIEEITQDPYEKVVLINDSLWYLLSYDMDSFNNKIVLSQKYEDTLKRGTCVCEGFSKAFTQMCNLAKIPTCEVRGFGFRLEKEKLQELRNSSDYYYLNDYAHQWNIVMVENNWYFADTTWNCSQTFDGIRNDRYMSGFLFSKPENFVKLHYPLLSEFQLLDNPRTLDQIMDYLIAGNYE